MTDSKMRGFKKAVKNNYKGWLFASPVILGILIFMLVPLVSSIYYSFTENDFFNPVVWVGTRNYKEIFTVDWPKTSKALGLTLTYTVIAVPMGLTLSYLLANLLNVKSQAAKTFRVLYYLPCIVPGIVGGLVWRDILQPDWGLMNRIFQGVGLPPSKFFSSSKSSLSTLIFISLFGMGGGMIMWLAQLKAIPPELYEAGKIDGAGSIRLFFVITIPLSTPMIFYNLVTGIIGSLQVFASILIITGSAGGADDSLMFYVGYIYRNAFERLNMGYAAALSWILFAIIAFLTFIMFKTSKWVQYAEGK